MIRVLARRHYVRIETSVMAALCALVLVGATVVIAGSLMVTRSTVQATARQAICAAKVREFKARVPLVAKGHVARAHPCEDLATLTGEVVK